MAEMATEWMKASYNDLLVINEIIHNDLLTHMVAFHSQQSIEKSFKSILESQNKAIPKKHDLLQLHSLVEEYFVLDDEELLEDINELYIDSRYPGDMGLLPCGKPTTKNAQEFYRLAQNIFDDICIILKITMHDISGEKNAK